MNFSAKLEILLNNSISNGQIVDAPEEEEEKSFSMLTDNPSVAEVSSI